MVENIRKFYRKAVTRVIMKKVKYPAYKYLRGDIKSLIPFAAISLAASGVGDTFLKVLSKGFFPLTIAFLFTSLSWDYY